MGTGWPADKFARYDVTRRGYTYFLCIAGRFCVDESRADMCNSHSLCKSTATDTIYRITETTATLLLSCSYDLDLDFDSTCIQVGALGYTLTPFWSVMSCHLCFLPSNSHSQPLRAAPVRHTTSKFIKQTTGITTQCYQQHC